MKQFVKTICPSFDHLVESKIMDQNGNNIGWHSVAIENNGNPIGGGTSNTKNVARRIAIAEMCERSLFHKIAKSDQNDDFMINAYPSTCGFAFGFDDTLTMYRAIAEACERWIWSKWIDSGYFISSANINTSSFSILSKYFISSFDSVLFYQMPFIIDVFGNNLSLKIGIALGINKNGIFPGSRVASANENVWEHALLEAYRHYEIYSNLNNSFFGNNIIYERIKYFGANKNVALNQIANAKELKWEIPELKLLIDYPITGQKCYLWRALCHNFISWEKGKVDRFVY